MSQLGPRVPLQDNIKPAVLRNRGNEYLNYEDDWYVLAFKPDKYALIYYKGNNDAWRGYGGATVYTKCATLLDQWFKGLTYACRPVLPSIVPMINNSPDSTSVC